MNIKLCKKCGEFGLDQIDFSIFWQRKSKNYYYRSSCNLCQSKNSQEYYKTHIERKKQHDKEYYQLNIDNYRKHSKKHYHENKEHYRELNKRWRVENPDYHKQYDVKYYKNNTDKRKQNAKLWRNNNYEKVSEYDKKHRRDNIEHHRQYQRNRYNNNKAYFYTKIAERRANKINQTPILTIVDKKRVFDLYKLCKDLNKQYGYIKYHVDHIVPISKRGLHHPDNLRIITANDNMKKQDKLDYKLQDSINIKL